MYYVYLLKSLKDEGWYIGFTNNLKLRIKKHNDGKVFSTKNRRPLKVIYCEICININDAIAREKYLKSGMGRKYLKNRLKNYLKINF